MKFAKLKITNNQSLRGGGIGTNGSIIIGTDDKLMDFEVNKVWEDNNDENGIRADKVEVALMYENIEVERITLNQNNDWSHTFKDLPIHKKGYTIKEITTLDGYEDTYKDNGCIDQDSDDSKQTCSATITNTFTYVDKTNVSIEKIWKDNNNVDLKRPNEIEVILLNDNVEVLTLILNEKNNWKVNLSELELGEYTIKEVNVPKGYTSKITSKQDQNNITFTIINTYKKVDSEIPNTGQNILYFSIILITISVSGLVIRKYIN